MKIPDGYQSVMPYLIIKDADGFISFLKDVFNATEKMRVPREEGVMHAEVIISGHTIMMADATEQYPVGNGGMFVYVEDTKAVYERALKAGATSLMEPTQQEYGLAAGFKDPFGNTWWPSQV